MAQQESGTATMTRVEVRVFSRPSRWRVIFHNDDVTTMDFVVSVLTNYFGKSIEEANQIMMQVHVQGKGVAGVYSKDVAETKIEQTTRLARAEGFPLALTMEEV